MDTEKHCAFCLEKIVPDSECYAMRNGDLIHNGCMAEHCANINCYACGYGAYPNCRFLGLKRKVAGSKGKDLCECLLCGTFIEWEGGDDVKGTIWCCEQCGEYYCRQCFIDRFSPDEFLANCRSGAMLCPNCYARESA